MKNNVDVLFIDLGSESMNGEDNINVSAILVGRYILYLLAARVSYKVCSWGLAAKADRGTLWARLAEEARRYAPLFLAAVAVMIYLNASLLQKDFILILVAYLITKYPEMGATQGSINYGIGMACSFFEGYLTHIIPSDGANFVGFEENIAIYESNQNVVFPVKKLFIVITKSLYCPPDLKTFNRTAKDDPYLEACQSLEKIRKDVAGVKNRIYRNSAYKIHRPGTDLKPVYLAVECASPLHTLHRVLEKRYLYEELGGVNVGEVVEDFCRTLRTVIDKSPDCRGRCELVYFDDTNSKLNLAEVLLNKIRDIEPNFERLIAEGIK